MIIGSWENPDEDEVCNDIDDNCINGIDEGLPTTRYYVDDDGDCVNGDGSQGNPYCRIQQAIDAALDGDTLQIAPGTYFENLRVDKSVQLIGAPAPDVTSVDGSATGRAMYRPRSAGAAPTGSCQVLRCPCHRAAGRRGRRARTGPPWRRYFGSGRARPASARRRHGQGRAGRRPPRSDPGRSGADGLRGARPSVEPL